MSSNFHTPIPNGANADDTVFNAPLSQLDQTITDILDGTQEFSKMKATYNVAAPNEASAALQVDSFERGVLMPRMTSTQRDAISSPAEGLLVWNETDLVISRYNGSNWANYGGGANRFVELIPKTPLSMPLGASLDITGISQDYQDLLFRFRAKRDNAGGGSLYVRFNNASGASDYAWARNYITIGSALDLFDRDDLDSEIEFFVGSTSDGYIDIALWVRNYTQSGGLIHGDFNGVWISASAPGLIRGGFEWKLGTAIDEINLVNPSGVDILGSYALYGIGSN